MSAPAALAAIPFLAGAASAIQCHDVLGGPIPFVGAVASLLALIAAVGWAVQNDDIEAFCAVVFGCALAGVSLGAASGRDAYDPPLLAWYERSQPPDPIVIEGVLREDAVSSAIGISLIVDVLAVDGYQESGLVLGGVRLAVAGALAAGEVERWRAGRMIRAPAVLRRPSTYLNPGRTDQRRSLARRGIVLVGSIKSAALIDVTRRGDMVRECAGAIRAWVRTRVSAHLAALDIKAAGVTTAVLIGDRSGLTVEDERRLQEAGTYHVIAISGGNIAILAVLGLALSRAMLVPSRAGAALTAAGLVFYGVVAAGAASVARAVTVAVLVLAGRTLDHRGVPLNALAVAAIVATAVSPVVVLDAGFILSFGATIGILLGIPRLAPRHSRSGSALSAVARRAGVACLMLLAATVCAEVVLAPVAATFFSRVTFAGLLLNFAAIPLMTVVQISGLVLAASSSISTGLADLAAQAAYLGASWLLRSSSLVTHAPWLVVDVRPPVWWVIAGYYASALALLLTRPRRWAASLLVIFGTTLLAGPSRAARDAVARGNFPLRVVVLDVGQGDSSLIQLPGRRALLVDAGGVVSFSSPDLQDGPPAFDIGERVVTPALRALGVARLDGLVITHGDPDHLQGARGLLRRVTSGSVWEGIPVPPHAGLQGLASVARARGIPWRTVQAGDSDRFGDVEVRVIHPALPDWERQRVRNEDSVVLEVRIGRVSIVLPGDIGREGEQAIVPRFEPDRLVVLKAPHHGSATSSTKALLEILRPAAVIFSCGRDNRFGHPHPAVLSRYRQVGSAIFSTAVDGAVFVETDGTTVEVKGWLGRRARFDAPARRVGMPTESVAR